MKKILIPIIGIVVGLILIWYSTKIICLAAIGSPCLANPLIMLGIGITVLSLGYLIISNIRKKRR